MALRHLALIALTGACLAGPAARGDDAAGKEALAELAAISSASGGLLGVSALNVKTGERLQLHAAERFPMASTFKVPLAIKVLDEVDRGAMQLDQAVRIDAEKTLTVGELLELMMRDSDNTATDLLLAGAGGPPAVTRHVRGLGLTGLEVNRPAAQLIADAWGISLPPRTGTRRLKGELPRGTVVAHKTGTLLRVATNDVGIITLPWGNGPVIVAIYLKGSPLPLSAQERSVAAAALVAYRHFSR